MTWPIMTLSIVLMVLSFVLTAFILLHKSRGGGLSDLFGGGMSTAMSGTSASERMLDRITVIIGVLWVACIFALLALQRHAG
ncbi:preprotein translocase subunit SecG [Propionibacterium sp.]|uniref:preprotein translocase subunit SecG n=1 Tax=Propionibacterium sp. TaxID=1977903 RepID=UPI0039EC799E